MVTLQDRFRGLLVGTAVGDALGRPVEGHREIRPSYLEEIRTAPRSNRVSDDTVMTNALTESLLACNGFDGDDMAKRFADEYAAEPWRGYGRNVVSVFLAVRSGVPWDVAAAQQFDGSGSYGNGSAMRVAPVAAWEYPRLGRTIDLARATSRVTHTHPSGIDGAVVQAVATHHALKKDLVPGALLRDLDRAVSSDEFRAKLEALPRALVRDDDEYARLHLGNWVAAHNSVVTALYCFLLSSGFVETLMRAIRLGGDTDTIGAMAGALAGARWGHHSIPKHWLAVEKHDQLLELADRLCERRRFAGPGESVVPDSYGDG